jgi:hypothetical protein
MSERQSQYIIRAYFVSKETFHGLITTFYIIPPGKKKIKPHWAYFV